MISASNPSLYIHIPVCTKKCDYCDFFSCSPASFPAGTVPVTDRITNALVREISERSTEFSVDQWNTVYIGGGTPSLLSPANLYSLCSSFHCDGEVSIEANPETITGEWLTAAENGGITRLSLGIQSFHDPLLQAVGRTGSANSVNKALELIAENWKGHFSVDLMCGLPGQTADMLAADIRQLSRYPVDHVSLYSLIIEPGTPLARRLDHSHTLHLPDNEPDLWFMARDMLEDSGFLQYEVSNFAKSGTQCRHNLVYWHMEGYLGAGPSAVGTMPQGDESVRYTNTRDIHSWLSHPVASQLIEQINRQDTLFEVLLMGFRLTEGIPRNAFRERFSVDVLDLVGKTATAWEKRGLLSVTSDTVSLTREGLPLLNRFLSDCLEELVS